MTECAGVCGVVSDVLRCFFAVRVVHCLLCVSVLCGSHGGGLMVGRGKGWCVVWWYVVWCAVL